jgi:hypothetical protein
MTLLNFFGGHMQLNFQKSVTWVFVLAALSFAMSVYSANHTTTANSYASMKSPEDKRPVKVENISIDYSRAHAELMKQPDESVVSSF